MKTRFVYELAVGIIGFVAVLYFGSKGYVALALFAFQPFIGERSILTKEAKRKWDEREYQLFYRVGNYTAGATIVALVVIFEMKDMIINNHLINDNWLGLAAGSFLMTHGISGLMIFRNN
jgi:hypothetical protein